MTLARLVRKPGRLPRLRNTAACCAWFARCMSHAVSSDASNGDNQERQQLLRQTLFPNTRWRDNSRQKRNPRSPDFRHKDYRDTLWLNDCYDPAWVEAQLTVLDARADPAEFAPAASLSLSHADQLVGLGYENRLTPEFVEELCKSHAVSSDASNEGVKRERQQLLWKTFFLDHTRWWDNRRQKRNPRSPDFHHKDSRDTLWLNNCYKPAWVDAQLAVLDARADPPEFAPPPSLSPNHPDQLVGLGYKNRLTPEFVKKLCKQGLVKEAVDALDILVETSSGTDKYLLYLVLKECVAKKDLMLGGQVHALAAKTRFGSDTFLCTHFIRMYAAHGKLREAMGVFRGVTLPDSFMWSSIISAYDKQGQAERAIELYQQMRATRIIPDNYVFVAALQACAAARDLRFGKQLHSDIKEHHFERNIVVGASLVNMYAKCGSLRDARIVFDGLRQKDVVTWNAMIAGYAQQDDMSQEALNIYSAMRNEGMVVPNRVTFVCLLQACASVAALQQGKELHLAIREVGLESHALIGNSLVNMYAQCGRLEISRQIFDGLPVKGVDSWTALINGYAEHGEGNMAIQCFEQLLEQGIQPNDVTYICLLTACSRAGLVDEGQRYFDTMEERHGIKPDERHYSCMVDLLGRSGHLSRAEQMLLGSPCLAGSVVSWTALLSACKSYGDADVGKRCFAHLVNLEPAVATAYVLLGCIYASSGRWEEVEKIETLRKAAGARKKAAIACIEVKKEVHKFTVGEERPDIAGTLRKMNTRVKEGGHVPQTQLVLEAVSEQEKEDALCGHAEKLALAYGLLNTPAGSTLLVTKNFRMCNDCHSSTKVMSRVEKREIVVRDGNKVHRFVNGACSCQDKP